MQLMQELFIPLVFAIGGGGQVGIDQMATVDDRYGLGQPRIVALALQAVGGRWLRQIPARAGKGRHVGRRQRHQRSEEHTSELQSLMSISYAVFCLKKKKRKNINTNDRYISSSTLKETT